MPATIFSGSKIKMLKDRLVSFSDKDLIITGTADPRMSVVDATKGTIYVNNSTNEVLKKIDDGSSTNWILVGQDVNNDLFFFDDFENNINNVGTPVDVSGFNTLSKSHNVLTPLIKTGSLRISKSANNGLGDYIPIGSFTINPDAPIMMLRLKLLANTSVGYLDNDFKFVAKIGATEIPLQPGEMLAGTGSFTGEFQTPPGGGTGTIWAVVNSINPLAYDIDVDNFEVSRSNIVTGIPEIDFGTPDITVAGHGVITSIAVYECIRVGSYLKLSGVITGQIGTSTDPLTITLPMGLKPKTTSYIRTASRFRGYQSTTTHLIDEIIAIIDSSSGIVTFSTYKNNGYVPSWIIGTDLVATNSNFNFMIEVPIQGWSSSTQLSENVSGREIVFKAHLETAASHTSAGGWQKVPIDTTDFDSIAGWDSVNKRYVIKESGYYDIFGLATLASIADTKFIQAGIYLNGSILDYGTASTNGLAGASGSLAVSMEYLQKDQYVELYAYQNDSASEAYSVSSLRIAKRNSGSQQIAASAKVYESWKGNAGQEVPISTSSAIFKAITKVKSSHSAYDPLTGYFTAPKSSAYRVTMNTRCTGTFTNNLGIIYIIGGDGYGAGSMSKSLYIETSTSFMESVKAPLSAPIYLNEGETAAVKFYHNGSNGTQTLVPSENYSWIVWESI